MQYEEKNYRDALQSYRRASVRLTQPVLIYASRFFVGRCLEATSQKPEARQQYEDLSKIADNNPFRDASRLSAGRMYADAGLREDGLKWLLPLAAETTSAQIKAEALARSGLLQVELGRPDDATKTFDAALALPEVAEKLVALGADPETSSPQELQALIASEMIKYKKIIDIAGAKAE